MSEVQTVKHEALMLKSVRSKADKKSQSRKSQTTRGLVRSCSPSVKLRTEPWPGILWNTDTSKHLYP